LEELPRRAGDPAFDDLEPRIRAELLGLRARARRILGDDDAAADAVQEALIALWREKCRPAHLRGWLVRTVVHRSLHARRSRRRRSRWEAGAGSEASLCTLCDPERELEAAEFWACLDRIIAGLPSDFREVLRLRDVEGLEYQEISQRLEVPIGTVRSRLHRAREKVQQQLTQSSRTGVRGSAPVTR
jgi:RNA polymerase sigma-70 factor (ECF subfamily)